MSWIIHTSYIEEEDWGRAVSVYVAGPIEAPDGDLDRLKAGGGFPFRLLDDDQKVYYEGRCEDESFAPLDDYGAPNAGCTIIEYPEWRQL